MVRSIVLLSLIVLTGCEGNWGQKFLDFANNESEDLSYRYARANLKQKWARTFHEGQGVLLTRLLSLQTRLSSIPISEVPAKDLTEEDLFKEAIELKNINDTVLKLDLERRELKSAITQMRGYCDNKDLFYEMGVDNLVVRDMMKVSRPELDITYQASTDMVETSVNFVMNLFDSSEQKEQQKKFDQGVGVIKRKTIKGRRLYNLSKKICRQEQKSYLKTLQRVEKLEAEVQKQFKKTYQFIGVRSRELDYYLMPELVERTARRYNLDDTYNYINLKKYYYRFDRELDNMKRSIRRTQLLMDNANTKLKYLTLKEKLIDQLHVSIKQLEHFLKVEKRPTVKSYMNTLLSRFTREYKNLVEVKHDS